MLVVTLAARAEDAYYTIASHMSDKMIVRASNPGHFQSEPNMVSEAEQAVDPSCGLGKCDASWSLMSFFCCLNLVLGQGQHVEFHLPCGCSRHQY